jgi:cellulose synthase operon protein C
VALLQPPAVIVGGDVGEPSPAVAFRLGAALAGTLPEHVLATAASEGLLGNVLSALQVAFGPPQTQRTPVGEVATLAGMLWETVPARAQRRLSELCEDPAHLVVDAALESARQVGRRYGLFVCGDLFATVRETCGDLGLETTGLDRPGALAHLCATSPAIADLVRLATSAEFADARWRRASGRHHGAPWSRF